MGVSRFALPDVRSVHWSISELKSAPAKKSRQLDEDLRHVLAPDGMALRQVAAKRMWRHKGQLHPDRPSPRIQYLKQSSISNPFLAAAEHRINLLNRLVQNAHKGQCGAQDVSSTVHESKRVPTWALVPDSMVDRCGRLDHVHVTSTDFGLRSRSTDTRHSYRLPSYSSTKFPLFAFGSLICPTR